MPNGARVLPEVQPSIDVPLAVTPEALGAGVGRAIQNAGDVAFDLHEKEVQKANETAILDADNQLNAFVQQRLYDPKTGVLKQPLGKHASAAADQTLADYDKAMTDVGSRLTNDNQRIAFQKMAQARRFHVEHQLGDYEEGETNRYDDEVDDAAIALASQGAIADPSASDDDVAQMRQVIARRGARKGEAPEATFHVEQAAVSATYAAIITGAADAGDTAGARAAFERWGDQIKGRDLKEVRGVLKTSIERGESRSLADTIVADLGEDADLQGALESLEKRGIENVDVYDQTKTRLTNTFRLAEEAENNRQAKLLDEAVGYIEASADPTNPDVIPDSVYSRMSAPYKRKAQIVAAARAKGVDLETPKRVFADLERMKATDPQAFAHLMTKGGALLPLSRSDYERYTKEAAGILKGDERLIASFQTDEQAIVQAMDAGGMKPAKGGAKQPPDEVVFRSQLSKAVTAEQQATGKKASAERIGEIGKTLMQEVVLKRARTNPFARLFDEMDEDTVRAFETPIAQSLAYSYDQVPADAAAEHRRELVKAGFTLDQITPDMIRARYNEDLVEAYRDAE